VLQEYFAPEFLNRFDEIVTFDPLSVGDLGVIVRKKILPEAEVKLRAEFNVRIQATDAGIRRLAEMAGSEAYGARELERVFRNHVLVPAIDAIHAAGIAGPAHGGVVLVDRAADGKVAVTLQSGPA